MAQSKITQWKAVLMLLHRMSVRNKDYTVNWMDIKDAFKMGPGITREDIIFQDVQTMVRQHYLRPLQCGIGVMDRVYEMGEESYILTDNFKDGKERGAQLELVDSTIKNYER